MLDAQIKSQLKEYFAKLEQDVTLAVGAGEHEKRAQLVAMLEDVAAQSERVQVRTDAAGLPSPISFHLLANGEDTGVVFSGVPGGHEFSSLILAILQAGGTAPRLDPGVVRTLKNIQEELSFQTIVSLDCHNCPEVVQTLNAFSLINPRIKHEMIDGALFPEIVNERKVQGVPAVFLNEETFSNGKLDAGGLIEKMLARLPEQGASQPEADAEAAQEEPYDVLIVGGGPAGVSSAVYSARKGLRVGMIGDRLGGQVKDTMDIENLIAIFKTTGPELAQTLSEQLRQHGIHLREHLRVTKLEDGAPYKRIVLNTGEVLQAKTVIISTGAKWRELGVPGEKENIGQGVAYCPHCDGPFFKGKDVAVVGGGNSGVEAALDLAGIVRSVKLIEFGPKLMADQVLVDRVERTQNIESITNAATNAIQSESGKVTGLTYVDRETEKENRLELAGVFVQIGLLPNSDFVADLLERNKFGEIVVDEKCRTSVPGIFACGDVTNTPYKQIVVALGEGAKASLASFEYLLQMPADRKETEKIAS